jgi:hypothetical protein
MIWQVNVQWVSQALGAHQHSEDDAHAVVFGMGAVTS